MICKLHLNVQERLQREGRAHGDVMDRMTEQSTRLKLRGRHKRKTWLLYYLTIIYSACLFLITAVKVNHAVQHLFISLQIINLHHSMCMCTKEHSAYWCKLSSKCGNRLMQPERQRTSTPADSANVRFTSNNSFYIQCQRFFHSCM